jgi:phage major head subunit gpT-like protein
LRHVRDFKQITTVSLTGHLMFEELGASGEIKHGTIADMTYTNQADTYAKMFAITRRDIINDDLGALTKVPQALGRGAALKLNDVFWTEFTADSSTFWTTGRLNYFEGAATNLQISSLTTAVQMFRDQIDADSKPLGIAPSMLVVPSALEVVAQNLFSGQNLVVGALGSTSAKSVEPNINPHAGKYKPVTSAYLGNAAYGNSSTAWYLLADPRDLAAIEVVFLNGQESPTIEQADADFSTLGIQMRGFHDFGVKKQEYRAGVKSKGAA